MFHYIIFPLRLKKKKRAKAAIIAIILEKVKNSFFFFFFFWLHFSYLNQILCFSLALIYGKTLEAFMCWKKILQTFCMRVVIYILDWHS